MKLKIDSIYLNLDDSHLQMLKTVAEYKRQFSYTKKFKTKDHKLFNFEYTMQIFIIDGFEFSVKQFKRGSYRLELFGLHQYNKDGSLKTNNVLHLLTVRLRYTTITRIDYCTDQKAKPQLKNLRTKKLVNFKSTIYHNLYSKNYFSSYIYNKQKKNNLSFPLWRTEFSFKGILPAKAWKYKLKDLKQLERKCVRFIERLHLKASKINE